MKIFGFLSFGNPLKNHVWSHLSLNRSFPTEVSIPEMSATGMDDRVVLEEQVYVNALDCIIRKQFYPELGRDPIVASTVPEHLLKLSLRQFLDNYTSEDNDALNQSIEQIKQKHREKYKWMHKESAPMLEYRDSQTVHLIEANKTIPKSSLMFHPTTDHSKTGLPLLIKNVSDSQVGELVRVANTRFPDEFDAKASSEDEPVRIYGGLKKTDYQLLLTPQVEKTSRFDDHPKSSQISVTSVGNQDESRNFIVPEAPRKEQIARRLAEKATKRKIQQVTPSPSYSTPSSRTPLTNRPGLHTPGLSSSSRSRRTRTEDFSPAAQRLLHLQQPRTPSLSTPMMSTPTTSFPSPMVPSRYHLKTSGSSNPPPLETPKL
jgi:hypothetical protein